MIGSWTIDPFGTDVPKLGSPDVDKRISDGLTQTNLKLKKDHTFTLSLFRVLEGKWKLDGKSLLLTPARGEPVRIEISPDRTQGTFRTDTPIGEAKISLRKTG